MPLLKVITAMNYNKVVYAYNNGGFANWVYGPTIVNGYKYTSQNFFQ